MLRVWPLPAACILITGCTLGLVGWVDVAALHHPAPWGAVSAMLLVVGLAARRWNRSLVQADASIRHAEQVKRDLDALIDRQPFVLYRARGFDRKLEYAAGGAALTGGATSRLLRERHPLESIIAPEERLAVRRGLERALATGTTCRQRYHIVRPDGERVCVEDHATAVRSPDAGFVVQGWLIEATQIAELEARARGASRMETLGRLAGDIGHDLNNVLTVASMTLEMVELERLSVNAAQDIGIIRSAVANAIALVKQIGLARRSAGDAKQLVRLRDLIEDYTPLLRRLVGDGVELTVELCADDDRVHAVPSELQQLLLNLVVNAGEAMGSRGRILIETTDERIGEGAPDGLAPGEYTRLVVRDDGRGMDAATRARMFDPSFSTKEREGRGLGMSIVSTVVRHSDAEIFVDSTPGRGTAVTIFFPRANATTRAAGVA